MHPFPAREVVRHKLTNERYVVKSHQPSGDVECIADNNEIVSFPPEVLELWSEVIRRERDAHERAQAEHDYPDS